MTLILSSFIAAFAVSFRQLSTVWKSAGDRLAFIHPVFLIVAVIGTTLLIQNLIYKLVSRKRRRADNQQISTYVRQFAEERGKSEAILADLDIGVMAFTSDGQLMNTNPAARLMLSPDAVPDNLATFTERYGQTNGLQAALLLGRDDIVVLVNAGERILRVRLKESRFDEGRRAGTIVVMQEITEQERLEKQRKEFVANVSHELKTPLTTIKTYSESLLDWGLDEKNSDAIRKDVTRIHDDALRMEHLVADLLLLSSIDSKGIRVRMEQQDLAQLVRLTVDRLLHQAQEKSILLESFAVTNIPPIYADRSSVERILVNLISNAVKYTDKGGSVKVYIGYLIDDVYVKVVDTGFGIEKEHLPHIFNRFYRVDMTGSRMFGGTGLGLSIARELAEIHSGEISVDSTLGKGTEFAVILPSARKVFRDTLTAMHDGVSQPDLLHRSAAADLQDCAHELFDDSIDLSQLSPTQRDQLLNQVIDVSTSVA